MTEKNRKILNATPYTAPDGTVMKSKTEVRIYQALLALGITPLYEEETFVYWKGPRPTVAFYDMETNPNSKNYRHLRKNMKKLVDITYTPDFTFMLDGVKIIIEVKGFENDLFPMKKKMFRAFLETLDYPVVYAEIFTKRQLLEFMEELKKVLPQLKEKKNMIIDVRPTSHNCKAVFYDGTNIAEVIALLGCEEAIRERFKQTPEQYQESGEQLVYTPLYDWFVIEQNQYLVNDNGIIHLFHDDAKFKEKYEEVK